MSSCSRLCAAVCAFTLACLLSSGAQAQTVLGAISGADTVIVTANANAGEPAIVAQARGRLSRTPGAVSVMPPVQA
jgi:iron complex outermembrane receptor protein